MYKGSSEANVMSYLKPQNGIKSPKDWKSIIKIIWKVTKICFFLFVIISMLWGCVQMYQSPYTTTNIQTSSGLNVLSPGLGFEIAIQSLGDNAQKHHQIVWGLDGKAYEFNYNVISTWGEAFTKTGSPFYGFFVYPLAYLLTAITFGLAGGNDVTAMNGTISYSVSVFFGIFFTVVIVKTITLAFGWKSQVNQHKLQELQIKQSAITAKYKGVKDPQLKAQQQKEISAMYKKEGLSQFSALTGSFASMPFLFAIFAVIRSTKVLKESLIGSVSLVAQPWPELTSGHTIYLAIIAVYLPLQIFSMLLPLILQHVKNKNATLDEAQRKARKKQWIMQSVMSVVFIIVIMSVATGVAIYWILSSTFQIIQTLGFFFYNRSRSNRTNQEVQRRLKQEKQKNEKVLKSNKPLSKEVLRRQNQESKRLEKQKKMLPN